MTNNSTEILFCNHPATYLGSMTQDNDKIDPKYLHGGGEGWMEENEVERLRRDLDATKAKG